MSVNLQKGQKVDLTKGNASLDKIIVGLGWDPVKQSGGFLSGIFGGSAPEIDCDASVILLNENDKLARREDLVYFGNLKHVSGSVQHMGDNLTGGGDGDDEQIAITLSKVPQNIQKLVFVVNIYDCIKRHQDFGQIQNAFIRVFNAANNQELLKFNLTDSYAGKTALLVGDVYRYNGEWKFTAIGEGLNSSGLSELTKKYL
jgi:tellurium resistance protein TerD